MTELFRLFPVIFVGTDVHFRTYKHRVLAREIFIEQCIDKIINLLLVQVQMVHSVFLFIGRQTRIIVREGQ